jgi:hypothetical protein
LPDLGLASASVTALLVDTYRYGVPVVIWLGGLAVILLLIASQEWFLETHRRRYGMWRSTRRRRLLADSDERSQMWRAATRRDSDPTVERVRLMFWAVWAFGFVALALLFLRPPDG